VLAETYENRVGQPTAVSFCALTASSRVRNLATFSIDPQKRCFFGFETVIEAWNQASRCDENGDEYTGKFT